MKDNTKYTALEILTEAGVKDPETKFGKMRVEIGGILGIVKPDHIVGVTAGTKKLDVVVGVEPYTLKIEKSKDAGVSEGARKSLDVQGKKDTIQFKLNRVKKEKK
jgi:hypothetical protein